VNWHFKFSYPPVEPLSGADGSAFPAASAGGESASRGPDNCENELWSVSEMRLYYDGVEIPRRAAWRVSAKPNWWDAPLAFDSREVTAWSTWQAMNPAVPGRGLR